MAIFRSSCKRNKRTQKQNVQRVKASYDRTSGRIQTSYLEGATLQVCRAVRRFVALMAAQRTVRSASNHTAAILSAAASVGCTPS